MVAWKTPWDYEQAIQDPESYHQITKLEITYTTDSLSELPSSLEYLFCYHNQLTSLPELPSSLKHLTCDYNQLTSLPELPVSLEYLECNHNKLTSLPELPVSLIRLNCDDNKITSLPELPSSLEILTCTQNQLTSLPELPSSLEKLFCVENQLTSLPELPSSLRFSYLRVTESALYTTLIQGLTIPQPFIPTPEITQIEKQIPAWLIEINSVDLTRYRSAYQEIIQARKLLQKLWAQPLEITL